MLDKSLRDKIILMYSQGIGGGQIARQLNLTNYKVYKCLRDAGFKIGARKRIDQNGMTVDDYKAEADALEHELEKAISNKFFKLPNSQ